ncbi:hypothetical protein FGB62_1g649 [Gracilaria domingensis]|nr:hypothetical protein FGB62_1g649 [Gracilaria domingensis]
MLHHCPNERCRYFSPNLYSLRYHLEQCVYREPDIVSPYTTSPCSSPIPAKRPKREHTSEPIGSHSSRTGLFLSERGSEAASRNVLEPSAFDRGCKPLSNSGSLHPRRRRKEAVAEKRSDMERTFPFRLPDAKPFPSSDTVLPENGMHVEPKEELEPSPSESKNSPQEEALGPSEQNAKKLSLSLLELQTDDPRHTKAELQDMHVDYMVVCLASVASSMGEKVADEIIWALNHPLFDPKKFKKGVTSARMCKERTNSIAKTYVGFAVRQRLRSVKLKQSED